MPIYVYEREDGTTFETIQRITEEPLNECPDTGQKVTRQISASTPIFKGSGFYKTDYCKSGDSAGAKKSASSSTSSSSSESNGGSDSKGTESKAKSCGTGCGCH